MIIAAQFEIEYFFLFKISFSKRFYCTVLFFVEYNTDKKEKSKTSNKNLKDTTISDILLWAVFANRKELAEVYWLRGENHLRNFYIHLLKLYTIGI